MKAVLEQLLQSEDFVLLFLSRVHSSPNVHIALAGNELWGIVKMKYHNVSYIKHCKCAMYYNVVSVAIANRKCQIGKIKKS